MRPLPRGLTVGAGAPADPGAAEKGPTTTMPAHHDPAAPDEDASPEPAAPSSESDDVVDAVADFVEDLVDEPMDGDEGDAG